jgi:predicted short-subunit dehydrogenase-like oxidoreductase (DUF2520 family)
MQWGIVRRVSEPDADSAQTPLAATSRLNVGVIGVGRAGGPIAAALDRAGHKVVSAYAVSDVSRLRAESLIPSAQLKPLNEVVSDVDLVLLAVPDDVLPGLVEGLSIAHVWQPGQFVVHLAGRYGVDVLASATAAGCLPLALHPVMTFTGTSVDLARLSACPFGVTAPDVLRPVAEALVVEMGGEPVWVPEEARLMYHAAIAHGANHLVSLVAEVMDLLRSAGIENPRTLIEPMMRAALENSLDRGDAALTGPVSRGDAGTVAAHIAEISKHGVVSRDAYVAMARLTADRALAAGLLSAQNAEALLQVLADA